jgi:hypothetical protein
MTIFVTPIKVPSISISANPSTYITQGTSVTFTATPVNCINPLFRWRINFNSTPVGTGITYTSTAINTGDKIVCDMICNDSCASPKGPQSNILAMYVWPANVNQLNSINLISIYPNPNNGSFTLDGKTSNNDPVKLAIINSIGQTLYHDIIKPENHELNTQLNVQLPQGIYILKLDNQTIRFTVSY